MTLYLEDMILSVWYEEEYIGITKAAKLTLNWRAFCKNADVTAGQDSETWSGYGTLAKAELAATGKTGNKKQCHISNALGDIVNIEYSTVKCYFKCLTAIFGKKKHTDMFSYSNMIVRCQEIWLVAKFIYMIMKN